jgi:hypothetical protein
MRQIVSVTLLNLKNLPNRLGASLVIVAGMAAAIGVLISILSLSAGYGELQRRTGDPGRAIVMLQTADTEGSGAIPRGAIGDIMAMRASPRTPTAPAWPTRNMSPSCSATVNRPGAPRAW